MSVPGEFERLLDECLAFLDGSSAADARWSDSLAAAKARITESLSEAAKMVLVLRSGPNALEAPRFGSASEAEAYESLIEHLVLICYAIVGR